MWVCGHEGSLRLEQALSRGHMHLWLSSCLTGRLYHCFLCSSLTGNVKAASAPETVKIVSVDEFFASLKV